MAYSRAKVVVNDGKTDLESIRDVIHSCKGRGRDSARVIARRILTSEQIAVLQEYYKDESSPAKDAQLCMLFDIGKRSRKRFLAIPTIMEFLENGVPENIVGAAEAARKEKLRREAFE